MSSNSQEKNDSSSTDEEIRKRYESKNLSGQKFDSEEDVIEISDSDSGQAIATNEKLMNTSSQDICTDSSDDTMAIPIGATENKHDICQTIDFSQTQSTQDVFGTDADSGQTIATNEELMNTSTQVIISDYSSDDTMPLLTGTTDDYGSGNEDKHDLCQTIDLSQTQSTQDVLGTDSDSEIPPMLTREYAGIYQKPFTRPKEDASTSFQQQDKLQADEFPLLKFGHRTEEQKRQLSEMIA